MKLETFTARIENGGACSLTYVANGKEGLVNIFECEGAVVLTWEECPAGRQYDEAEYTRDERYEFRVIAEVVDFMQKAGLELEQFERS